MWLLLAAMCVSGGEIGLALAFVNPSAAVVWPPTGIALAAVLIFGPRVWPGVFLGSFMTSEAANGSLATSLLIAAGNTAEALLAASLVNRFAGGRSVFDRARNIGFFVLFAGLGSSAVSATLGVTSLSLFGAAEWPAYWQAWSIWWLGHATGAMVVAPALLLWHANPRLQWPRRQCVELSVLFTTVAAVGWTVFVASAYPLGFLCIPLCVWTACRFGQREATTATCLLSLIAIWGTVHGVGTFGDRSVTEALALLQSFMAVTSIIGITVGAAVSGRRAAEALLRRANDDLESRVRSRGNELQTMTERVTAIEARLIEAQNVAHIGSWEWRVKENQVWWSDEIYSVFSMERAPFEPSYEALLERVHPDDRATILDASRRCFEWHEPFEVELRVVRPDGQVRTIIAAGRAAVGPDGELERMLGTARDIAERKAAHDLVSQSERRLQTIIDAEPACVKLVSSDGLLLEMNRAGLEMIGATDLSQIAGSPVTNLVHPSDRDRFTKMHRAASGGSPGRLEFRVIALNGDERWVESHFVPFDVAPADRDTQRAVLSVTNDVTERKHLEEQLRQGHKMEAVGLLAGGIAHDFNNLLTAIGGYTEFVMATLDERDSRHTDLLEVRKAAERAATLTRQLLAFSRQQVMQSKVLDLNVLVADVHKLLQRTIPEHITFMLDLSPVLDNVRADSSQLQQVLMNLAVNAADAMPQGGALRLATSTVDMDAAGARRHPPMTPGRYVRLVASDTGIGMSPETMARVFEPFFTTKQPGKGTGLGLATVYGIVKQSGGFIWLTSQPQQGTSVEIYLPAVQEPVESALPVSQQAEPIGGTETILLAEDDGGVRRLARDVLRKYGYHVLEARDGDDALSIAKQYDGVIHLLVTDVVMPGLSGRQLVDRLVQVYPDVKILYSSGYSANVTEGAGLELALPLLAKPYALAELLHKVRETLDG